LKIKLYLLFILSAISLSTYLSSCTPNNPQPNPTPSTPQTYSVKYRFVCPQECNVYYANGTMGDNNVNGISGIWEWNETMQSGDYALMGADIQNGGDADVLIEIYVNSVLKAYATGSGPDTQLDATYYLP
jgi:hypothetical protein